ncbi:Primosomal protein N [Tepidanaerobacter acetatoxydans Re1]|uniref:Replication restart protein PriA n=1 Tax=Tepidanaerobacter acetatoxydans (strain DSM 21804 / JCM 16047 / Re1) TaxID=1209989 RepID=F4LVM9_TEPAE|nr:primosomal protein N' [Tepidanaerobacter acetatoxydans]AEE91615.1 primosomal protein N' [Tepidanaerobacter acetatoxydans Re1]CDI40748.1 Primosomal protein N [Tepidanaerobacter acetatoxydans Re1]
MIKTCLVAVDVRHPKAKREYTYLVPEDIASSINIGDLVCVPFNNIKVTGVVTELFDFIEKTTDYELKAVISKEAISLPMELVDLSKLLAEYYGTPIVDFLKLMLPPKVSSKTESVYSVCSTDKVISSRAFNQKRVLEYLKNVETATVHDISENLKMPIASVRSALTALTEKGVIKRDYRVVRRRPMVITTNNICEHINLTIEQQNALTTIIKNFNDSKRTTLIYGVTGSGKTEVYIRAIENVLKAGKKVIMLVPEISLTPQMLSIFRSRFPGKTAVLHSKLSQGERFDEWQRIYSGEALVVLGARSAIFAPIKDLGMIIIDEEHESSYKNGEHPYYDARTVAEFRAKKQNASLVLGSATPSVESFYKAAKQEYSLAKLTKRVSGRSLPKLEIIDMREELKSGNRHIFSRKLLSGMKETLEKHKQIILFLNRRGHSTFVICRDCGFVLKCKYCDIALTYHFEDKSGKCHYCGYSIKAPDICPKCKSRNIRYFGAGTEKVEQEVKRFFPKCRTIRIDSDSTSRKGSLEKMLLNFKRGGAQILIGTQTVAKGLNFPDVALVGIISADTALNMPDFRSGERTFQLITQVAGRSGRGDTPGMVYVQTYTPESFAIRAACNFDISGFYQEELKIRREALYPPFCHMLNIVFKSRYEDLIKKEAEEVRQILYQKYNNDIEIYGPVPAPRSKIKDNYRYNILLKSKQIQTLVNICNHMQILNNNRKVDMSWDMEPLDLL